MQTFKNIALRSLLLFLAAPLINSLLFGIGTVFRDITTDSLISQQQYNNYQNSMMIILLVVAISILAIESLYSYAKVKKLKVSGLYFLSTIVIIMLTLSQFSFRPLEHTLSIISVFAIIPVRIVLEKLTPKLFKKH